MTTPDLEVEGFMTEKQQRAKQRSTVAWTVLGATAFLCLLIGLGSALSDAPADRAAAPLLLSVFLIGLMVTIAARFRLPAMPVIAAGLAAVQAVALIVMLLRGIGNPVIVGLIHALLVTGWTLAAFMFWRSTHEDERASRRPG